MQTEPQITFRDIEKSESVKAEINEKIAGLEQVHDRITSCRVTLEKSTARGQKGHLYHVAVEVEVPGGTVIVNRKPGDIGAHEDLHVAIRDSFNAARRQLGEYARKMKGVHVKTHPETHYGTVVRLFPDEGYGFVKTEGGLEVFFDRSSVVNNDWEGLDILSDVSFSLMDGEKGPFAANVSLRG